MKVMIVEDHVSTATGLKQIILEQFEEKEITVYTFYNPKSATQYLNVFNRSCPSLILLDLDFGSEVADGFAFCEHVKSQHPFVKVIAYSGSCLHRIWKKTTDIGMHSYLDKKAPPDVIKETIVEVLSGNEKYLHSWMKERLKQNGKSQNNDLTTDFNLFEQLTGRQQQIALEVATGKTSKEVASMFNIGHETVRSHLRLIYGIIRINSRHELKEFMERNQFFNTNHSLS